MSKEIKEVKADTKPKRIEIELAFLHQSFIWPGTSGTEKTLSAAKIRGLKMYLMPEGMPEGLLLELKGKRAWVPAANIANAVFSKVESEDK